MGSQQQWQPETKGKAGGTAKSETKIGLKEKTKLIKIKGYITHFSFQHSAKSNCSAFCESISVYMFSAKASAGICNLHPVSIEALCLAIVLRSQPDFFIG